MNLWQIFGIISIAFLILEMFTPHLFFLNFSVAALITSIVAIFIKEPYILTIIFVILSMISLIFLRPILVKKLNKNAQTGLEEKYIGKIAKVDRKSVV